MKNKKYLIVLFSVIVLLLLVLILNSGINFNKLKGAVYNYTCASGYTPIGNQQCQRSYAATAHYGCPSGYYESGNTCLSNSTYSSTSYFYCPDGYSQVSSSNTCSKMMYPASYYFDCPDGYSQVGSSNVCTKTISRCPLGGELVGTKCHKSAQSTGSKNCPVGYTYNYLYDTCLQIYDADTSSCPEGGTLSGTTCKVTANKVYYCVNSNHRRVGYYCYEIISGNSGTQCANGGVKDNNDRCHSTTGKVVTAYSCDSGDRRDNSTCYHVENGTKKKVIVKYNMNGGSLASTHGSTVGTSGSFATINGRVDFDQIYFGDKLPDRGLSNADNPESINIVKTGYIAKPGAEWNTKADGSGRSYSQDGQLTSSQLCPTEASEPGDCVVTLYVNWRKTELTIKYHLNGGSLDSNHGEGVTVNSNNFIQINGNDSFDKYQYGGTLPTDRGLVDVNYSGSVNIVKPGSYVETKKEWNTKADGTGTTFDQDKVYNVSEFGCDMKNKDCTVILYPKWKKYELTIKYNMNGGTLASKHGDDIGASGSLITKNGETFTETYYYGNKIYDRGLSNYNNSSSINIVKEGYTTKVNEEWNTKADGTGTTFNQYSQYNVSDFCDISNKNCTVTLYVKWIVDTGIDLSIIDGDYIEFRDGLLFIRIKEGVKNKRKQTLSYLKLPVTFSVFSHDDKAINGDDDLVGTDSRIELPNDSKYTTVVYGDVSKDGKIDNSDISMTFQKYRLTDSLDRLQEYAADYNKDSHIDMTDIAMMYRRTKGKD